MTFPNPWGESPPGDADRDRAIRMACLHMAVHLAGAEGAGAFQEHPVGSSGLVTAVPRLDSVMDAAKRFHEFVETAPGISPHRVALEEIRDMLTGPDVMVQGEHLRQVRSVINGALGMGR